MLQNRGELGSLAPIEVVMLREAFALCVSAAFERKAGSSFPNCLIFPLLNNPIFNRWVNSSN